MRCPRSKLRCAAVAACTGTTACLVLLLAACGRGPQRVLPSDVCDRPAVERFALACIEYGNPHSDEEGEDLARECTNNALGLYCDAECSHRGGLSTITCYGIATPAQRSASDAD